MSQTELPVVGTYAKFFHPGTLGVMLFGLCQEVDLENGQCRVRFDDKHPTNGRKVFWVPLEHIPRQPNGR